MLLRTDDPGGTSCAFLRLRLAYATKLLGNRYRCSRVLREDPRERLYSSPAISRATVRQYYDLSEYFFLSQAVQHLPRRNMIHRNSSAFAVISTASPHRTIPCPDM